jgi:hypothetical protein
VHIKINLKGEFFQAGIDMGKGASSVSHGSGMEKWDPERKSRKKGFQEGRRSEIERFSAVFRIHDIFVWIQIRIRGSMSLTNGSGSCYFRH